MIQRHQTRPRAMARTALAALIATGLAGPAGALDYVWLGAHGSFESAANWSFVGVPGSGDTARIGAGQATLSSDRSLQSFYLTGGSLIGTGNLSVSDVVSLTGGQLGGHGGQVIADGGLIISGNSAKTLGANGGSVSSGIVNNAAATWSGLGNLDNWATGRFTNGATGSLDIQTDADFLNGSFINQGALVKSVGSVGGSTRVTASFNNSGSVNVQQGVLSFTNGGTHTGSFTTGGDGWIEFAGGNSGRIHSLEAGASVSGNVRFTDAFTATVVNAGATYNATRTEMTNGSLLTVADGVTANTGTAGISGGIFRGPGQLVASGLVSYSGGQIGGDGGQLVANGGLAISGSAPKYLGANGGTISSGIVNNGAATWTGTGNLDNWATGRFTNGVAGSLDIQSDADFLNGVFINQGALTKSVGAVGASTRVTAAFHNSGSVNVQQGVLSFTNGGTHTGSFTTGSDGWIEFAGGNSGRIHSLEAGASVSGNVRFTDAFTATVVNAGATYNATRTEMTNGSLLTVADGVTANTGTAGISGGIFRGPGQLVASGLVSYSGGQIGGDGGQLVANGGLAISGSAPKYLGANGGSISSGIVNNGAATWTGTGNLDNWSTGRFVNGITGSLDIQSDADFLNGVFINQGALTKSVGAVGASTRVTASFDNAGTVNVQQGVLSFTQGGTHTGSFTTSATGWIEFAGGSSGRLHTLATGASVGGNVRFTDAFTPTVVNAGVSYNTTRTELVSGGLLQVAAGVTANTATAGISGGALRGAGELVASGPVSYTGGQIGGEGGQLVALGGLAISGNSSKTLGMNGGTMAGGIANHGAATWSGNSFDNWANGRFVNAASGSLDIQTDADFIGGAFVNQGSLVKSVGAGGTGTVFNSSFSNTGAIEVQQGSLEVRTAFNNQGSLAVTAGAVFHGNHASFTNTGSVQGAGTVRTATHGALLNDGLIAPGFSVGTLTLDGDLTMTAGGSLQVELTSLASFDQLVITDDAFFAGTLSVVGLGYTPVVGDSFRIITLDQRLAGSQFAALTVSGFSGGVTFDVTYNLHDVTLTVASVTAVPEPATWMMGLAGVAAVGAIVRRRRLR